MSEADTHRFDAVILAGGAARRMGGEDKALITIGASTLLQRVLGAVAEAERVICVGPTRNTEVDVEWTQEAPPGGGPVAALAAGLARVTAPITLVAAVDLPFLQRTVVSRLVTGCIDCDAALVVDESGVPQPLIAAYRTDPLRQRLSKLRDPMGVAMKDLLEGLSTSLLEAPGVALDCDTRVDVQLARANEGVR